MRTNVSYYVYVYKNKIYAVLELRGGKAFNGAAADFDVKYMCYDANNNKRKLKFGYCEGTGQFLIIPGGVDENL